MPWTTAQVVRSRINAPYIYDDETIIGDGTASAFKLKQGMPFSTISATATASVAAAAGWSATAATFDYVAGRVIFATALWTTSAVKVDYLWSIYGEDDVNYFISAANSAIPEAALIGVRHLMVDYAKRGSWAAPDGSTYNDTQALNALKAIESGLMDEIHGSDVGPIGDVNSWAETQQDWWG